MFQMCGVFAEFERSIIRERINAGLARAKANGKRLGRPTVKLEVEPAIFPSVCTRRTHVPRAPVTIAREIRTRPLIMVNFDADRAPIAKVSR
jgi:hypothetical protein